MNSKKGIRPPSEFFISFKIFPYISFFFSIINYSHEALYDMDDVYMSPRKIFKKKLYVKKNISEIIIVA